MEKTYLRRSLDGVLLNWVHKSARKPLMLRGARQVGKTALVRNLATASGLDLCELNFERLVLLKTLFSDASNLSPQALLPFLGAIAGKKILPSRTLLFLDEIQECPQAIVSLRYFFERE